MTGPPDPPPIDQALPNHRRGWLIAAAVVLAAAGIGAGVGLTQGSSPTGSGTPDYQVATVLPPRPVGTSAVKVGFFVRNTGTGIGTPTCTVTVSSSSGSRLGSRTSTVAHPVKARGIHVYSVAVPVAHGAADFVTSSDVKVTCH